MKKRAFCLLLALLLLVAASAQADAIQNFLDKYNRKRITVQATPEPDVCCDAAVDFGDLRDDGFYYSTRYKRQNGNMLVKIRFKNMTEDQTIDAVDFAMYCTNAYGEAMYPDDEYSGTIRYFSADIKIKPGKQTYTGYCRMDGCKAAKGYSIALTRYHTTDGEIYEYGDSSESDPLKRYHWLTWSNLD